MNIHRVDRCASTSTLLISIPDAPHGYTIVATAQDAGRGQRGNSWESEPGANLTFSTLLRPSTLAASRLFELSMLISLAIVDSIDSVLKAHGSELRCAIKWPNDIYVGDRKICGILIENRLSGAAIDSVIAGIGINVNQRHFLSDAPNPVSIIQLTGRETALEPMLEDLVDDIVTRTDAYCADPDIDALRHYYMSALIRTSGSHAFEDADGRFEAHIVDVAPDGVMTLSNGRSYHFKEVTYIFD